MTQHPDVHRKQWLEQLVKDNEFTLGAELGVHEGVTHFYLLDRCPKLTMIGVDRYQGNQEKYWEGISPKLEEKGIRSIFYRMSTVEAATYVGTGELDFVFIDADHRYNSVLADIKAWKPKVRKGGYITGHDCNLPEVKKALIEVFGEDGYKTAQDEVWYVQV
jgi:predicted O-methyltransferase YrrM